MQEESKQGNNVKELASDFASRLCDKTEDVGMWQMLYDSAIHFYNIGREVGSSYKQESKEQADKSEIHNLTKELVLRIYSEAESVNSIVSDPSPVEEAVKSVAYLAHEQAKAIIKQLNK